MDSIPVKLITYGIIASGILAACIIDSVKSQDVKTIVKVSTALLWGLAGVYLLVN